ncbi:PDZ domain-containing protein, partial [Beggiatoa alba]|nr:PDZ domain-containing protein [Beggiatoa alba]
LALSGADTQTTHKDESTAIKKPTSAAAPAGNTWFNQQALIDAGMGPTAAQQLKTQFEELELAKLYLRDQAIREGWAQGKRYRDERLKLDSQTDNIKQEFGEDIYDAYLYASGQSNRVAVQSVLSGSAASNAGLLADDQVIRYSGQRIYNWRDLRNATTEGDLTDTVAIEILRDDKRLEFYVQRGPLGIRMTSVSEAP